MAKLSNGRGKTQQEEEYMGLLTAEAEFKEHYEKMPSKEKAIPEKKEIKEQPISELHNDNHKKPETDTSKFGVCKIT